MVRIAALVSGGGTNLQALLDRRAAYPGGEVCFVLASKPDAYALERARLAGVAAAAVPRGDYPDRESFTDAIVRELLAREIDLVVLAGFLYILSPSFVRAFEGRVINVHPSLIPSFCGAGFYGLRVHQAALDYGVKVTGATVHIVTEGTDEGPILLQKAIAVLDEDTPESLQKRVMTECEHVLLPQAVGMLCARLAGQTRKERPPHEA
ncbi:MAG: phosphoribosylglycinamide formyltransferase [Oscillospiraceae bacterium]|nr:phosphoribosylglycinamide formyltransferase [Oscillospiraceae bacterium]